MINFLRGDITFFFKSNYIINPPFSNNSYSKYELMVRYIIFVKYIVNSNFLLFVKSRKSSFYCPSIDLVFFITYKLDSNNDFENLFTNNINENNVIKLKLTLKKIKNNKDEIDNNYQDQLQDKIQNITVNKH